jgi:hypothetical protein
MVVGSPIGRFYPPLLEEAMESLPSAPAFFTWPFLTQYSLTLFGAMAMYVFSLHKGFHGAVAFLRTVAPGHQDVFYARLDFVLSTVIGSIIGYIAFMPATPFQALAAGFGWVGTMNVLIAQGDNARPNRGEG